jgi:hypothetical protein
MFAEHAKSMHHIFLAQILTALGACGAQYSLACHTTCPIATVAVG